MRQLRFFGLILLHTLFASIGTEIATGWISRLLHPASLEALLTKYLLLSVLGAAALGFMVQTWLRTEPASAAYWAWVMPALLFLTVLLTYAHSQSASVFSEPSHIALLKHFFLAAEHDVQSARDFTFTVTVFRGISYSLAAFCSRLIFTNGKL